MDQMIKRNGKKWTRCEKVMVPVRLTDAMRERMRQIEDGPTRSHDEVWAEMLDAALIQEMEE